MSDPDLLRRFEAAADNAAVAQQPKAPTGLRRTWGKITAVALGPPTTVTVELEPGGTPVGPLRVLATGILLAVDDYVFMANVDGDVIVYGRVWSGAGDERSAKRITRIVYSGTTHTMGLADVNDVAMEFTSNSPVTLTIPANTFTDGDSSEARQIGNGQITIVHATSSAHLLDPNGAKSAHKNAVIGLAYRDEASSDEWLISGDTST
jgi:hypothetical protein